MYNVLRASSPAESLMRDEEGGALEWPVARVDIVMRPALFSALDANSGAVRRRDLVLAAIAEINEPNLADIVGIAQFFVMLSPRAAAQRNDMWTIIAWFIKVNMLTSWSGTHACVRESIDLCLVEVRKMGPPSPFPTPPPRANPKRF